MNGFDLENGDEWVQSVEVAFAELGLTSADEIEDLAHDIEARMKESAPLDRTHGGRHGRTSIDTRKGRDREGPYVDVGPTEKGFWLGFYEFGTKKQPPRPFMRPSIEAAVAGWGK